MVLFHECHYHHYDTSSQQRDCQQLFGIPIKQIVYHCETFKEAHAISEERANQLERDLNIQCHVPGPLAEKLFNSHRRLSLVVNHKFTHHNPRKTSTDVALIEIANGVSVSKDDCVNTRGKEPLNYAQLGLKSRFLHDSYIRSLHGLSGQSVEVVCAGAVSGFNRLVRSISEKPEHVLEREGLQSASTNLETRTCNYLDQQAQVSTPVHMQAHVPAIIHESRKEEVYSRRTLRFYNQLAVNNIPFEQGDSGACIYITNGYTETGCLGMAIADLPGGGCIVTPMAKLLEKLGLI
ncbi:unnamed protein product [Mytilus edulis]|uniref:Uncharacterized protein n=1 Tax=Mytilus edulis TaxID=6550 RepID=A0A8S3T1C0_MYTED|nr:unnamed protein product [Mytilus edulis]